MVAAVLIATLIAYPHLPERVPCHWNWNGQVDDYSAKWTLFVIVPSIMMGLMLLFAAMPWLSPRPFEVDSSGPTYLYIMLVVLGLMAYIQVMTIWAGLNSGFNADKALTGGISLMFSCSSCWASSCVRCRATSISVSGHHGRSRMNRFGMPRIASGPRCLWGAGCLRWRSPWPALASGFPLAPPWSRPSALCCTRSSITSSCNVATKHRKARDDELRLTDRQLSDPQIGSQQDTPGTQSVRTQWAEHLLRVVQKCAVDASVLSSCRIEAEVEIGLGQDTDGLLIDEGWFVASVLNSIHNGVNGEGFPLIKLN